MLTVVGRRCPVGRVTDRLREIEDLLALPDLGAITNQLMDEVRPCRKAFHTCLKMIKFFQVEYRAIGRGNLHKALYLNVVFHTSTVADCKRNYCAIVHVSK